MKFTKKLISVLLALALLVSVFATLSVTANAAETKQSREETHIVYTSGDYKYENIDGNSIIFWEYTGDNTNLVVPEKIDGKTVTMLARGAFYDKTSLKSITLPKTLTYIKGCAFWGCTSLENIVIPNGVTTIEEYAFAECASLSSVTIPKSVTAIGDRLFFNVSDVTVYGYKNSEAETYVSNYYPQDNIKFVAIDEQLVKGDANGDGVVTVADVTYMQLYLAGNKKDDGTPLIDVNNKSVLETLDMNGDGKLTVADVTELQMYIAEQD